MRFLIDENVSKASAVRLRMHGHEVIRIGTDRKSLLDPEIIRLAIEEYRIIITHDQDFGELVFKQGHKPPEGVILFRYEPVVVDEVGKRVELMVRSGLYVFAGHLTAVDESRIRQRAY